MLIISLALCSSLDYDYNDCNRNKNTNLHPKLSNLVCNPFICARHKLISLSALLCSINYRLYINADLHYIKG